MCWNDGRSNPVRVIKDKLHPGRNKTVKVHCQGCWRRGALFGAAGPWHQVYRILEAKEQLESAYENGSPPSARRTWKQKHPVIDEGVFDFVSFVRSQRLPVSSDEIRERARMIAEAYGITAFKSSSGWVQKSFRRTGIQKSLRLHVKGGGRQSLAAYGRSSREDFLVRRIEHLQCGRVWTAVSLRAKQIVLDAGRVSLFGQWNYVSEEEGADHNGVLY